MRNDVEELAGFRREGRRRVVIQPDGLHARGGQGDESASHGADDGRFGLADLAIVHVARIVFLPGHVDVGANRLDGIGAQSALGHGHVIDARQGGQGLRPQVLVEQRPRPRPQQIGVGRDRHHQHAAQLPGLLQMADRADVQQIERAVGMNDRAAFRPPLVQSPVERFDRLEFFGLRHHFHPRDRKIAIYPDSCCRFQGHETFHPCRKPRSLPERWAFGVFTLLRNSSKTG